jgi:hypothetical protein
MSATEWLMENVALVVAVVVFVIFTVGLVLAMRTPGGRDALAAASVRLAVAFLGMAERWLGQQPEPPQPGESRTVYKQTEIALARVQLTAWIMRRQRNYQPADSWTPDDDWPEN